MTDEADLTPEIVAERRAARLAAGFAEARARLDPFTRRHFSIAGTLRLHRHALGWDLLKAPANAMLAPVNIVLRLLAVCLHLLGLRRLARRIAARPLMLRTAVSARLEGLIRGELLAPALMAAEAAAPLPGEAGHHLDRYGEARGAVAEFTTSLGTIGTGAAVFKTVAPGVMSLAPAFAVSVAQAAAVAAFPLGSGLGALWYGWFPPEPSPLMRVQVTVGLIAVASVATVFAGVVADPIQLWTGIHRRRLARLIDALEAEMSAPGSGRFHRAEPYLARLWDATDAGMSLIRVMWR